MAIDWDTELLAPVMAIFGEGSPAVPATLPLYTPQSGQPLSLPGAVFDQSYHRVVELADGSQGTSEHPVLGVRASLFLEPPRQGDVVYVPSVDQLYSVTDVRPDNHGHILLILIEAE